MNNRSFISRSASHVYVVTIVWVTMSITLGFIETPLRFSAPIERSAILEIGHRVFHALNYCEIVFACITSFAVFVCFRERTIIAILGCAIAIVFIQTLLLFLVLDERTLLVISGGQPPPSHTHLVYIVLEILKIGILVTLTSICIRSSRNQLIKQFQTTESRG